MTWEEYTSLVAQITHEMQDDFNGWLNWAHRITDNYGRDVIPITAAAAIRLAFLCGVEQGVRYPAQYDCTIQ